MEGRFLCLIIDSVESSLCSLSVYVTDKTVILYDLYITVEQLTESLNTWKIISSF